MILDIESWKSEIGCRSEALELACSKNDEFEIEKNLYYLAISVRKMLENRLCSKKLSSRQIKIMRYQPQYGAIDARNYTDARAHYDLKNGEPCQMDFKRMIDIIIHSSFLDWRLSSDVCIEFILSTNQEMSAVGILTPEFKKLVDGVRTAEFKTFPLPVYRSTT